MKSLFDSVSQSNKYCNKHINTHTHLAGLDKDNNPQSIFLPGLKTSIEKSVTALTQTLGNKRQDNKRTDEKRRRRRQRPEGILKKRKGEEEKCWFTIPGTDDQFVLAGVKGQLWVIHRALRLEPEDPWLHLWRGEADRAQHNSEPIRAQCLWLQLSEGGWGISGAQRAPQNTPRLMCNLLRQPVFLLPPFFWLFAFLFIFIDLAWAFVM